MYYVKSETIKIPSEAIRLRVIANSNSEVDQKVKFQVKENVENVLYELLKNAKGVEEARKIINDNIDMINDNVSTLLEQEKYPLSYEIKYGLNYFPEKEYNKVTYEEGYYESLVITLGEGNGNNWWCVLFPPLCLMEAEETEKDEVEYKFFIQELIEKYL
jgi:stage II sporulation protein R